MIVAPSAASAAGRTGLVWATIRLAPVALRTELKWVCSIAPTWPASPTTWNERLCVSETISPAARIAACALAMDACVGPNVAANCAGVSHW